MTADQTSVEPRVFDVRCPADGRPVGTVADFDPAQISAICAELRAGQPAWEGLGPAGRRVWLLRWLDWLLDNEQRLLEDGAIRDRQVLG